VHGRAFAGFSSLSLFSHLRRDRRRFEWFALAERGFEACAKATCQQASSDVKCEMMPSQEATLLII